MLQVVRAGACGVSVFVPSTEAASSIGTALVSVLLLVNAHVDIGEHLSANSDVGVILA